MKECLNESRRQLEKMNEDIKELDSVEAEAAAAIAAAAATNSASRRHWRNSSSKRNSFESDVGASVSSCERRRLDFDSRHRRQQPPPPPPPHAGDVTDAVNTKSASMERDFERRRLNGRPRDLESHNHKNDTKQIENVIDAILEDSKKPDFQVPLLFCFSNFMCVKK